MNNFQKLWIASVLLIGFVFIPMLAHCDEGGDAAKAFCVGTGLLFAPIPLIDKDLSLGHTWELEGFSYAATDIGYRFLPKDLKWASPLFVLLLDFSYRTTQPDNSLRWRKFGCDSLGILGRVVFEL